jgi:tRNA nucleotidyltransferase/poly(A) polymerase
MTFPYPVRRVLARLTSAGYGARVAGGAVRDLLLGLSPKDYDVATTARPETVVELFEQCGLQVIPTGLQHGTVTVVVPDDEPGTPKNLVEDEDLTFMPVEITTLRVDRETDGRHAVVEFTDDWEADAARRDFTINAMFMDAEGQVYDFFGGQRDLEHSVVRFVGNADARIQEDYLRILRFYRFAARFGNEDMCPMLSDREAIRRNLAGLDKISGERIWMELAKMIRLPGAHMAFFCMALDDVFPAIGLPMVRTGEFAGIRHHTDDPITCLVGAISDERMPLEEARQTLMDTLWHRYKVSKAEFLRAQFLLDHFDPKPFQSLQDYLRLITEQNEKDQDFAKESAQFLALLHDRPGISMTIAVWTIPTFPLTGKDLIARGIKPGPEMGTILRKAKTLWINSQFVLNTDDLVELVKP